jgi:rhomboid protease GluP
MTLMREPQSEQIPIAPPAPRAQSLTIPLTRPIVSYFMLGFTILIFILQFGSLQLWNVDLVAAIGVKNNAALRAGEYWRFLTPIFLHANELHILFNMYALFQLGPMIESVMGRTRFISIYFLSGVAGVVCSLAFSTSDSLGASGAIFGLIGAWAVYLYRHRSNFGAAGRSALMNVVVIILLNIGISLLPGIDLWAHFGGLITGAMLAMLAGPLYIAKTDSLTGVPHVVDTNPLAQSSIWITFVGLLILAAAFAALQWGVV